MDYEVLFNQLVTFIPQGITRKEAEILIKQFINNIKGQPLLRVMSIIAQQSEFTVEKMYDSIAQYYEAAFSERKHIMESLTLIKHNKRYSLAIDLGCGTGLSTQALLNIADFVIGLDISNNMLAKARKRIDSTKVKLLKADFTENIPKLEERADFIFSVGATRHIPEGKEFVFLENVVKLLKPGGESIITFVTPAENLGSAYLDYIIRNWMESKGLCERRFSVKEIKDLYSKTGLTITELKLKRSGFLYDKVFVCAVK
ncbi:class I SAM-dependent methyltransferase [Carboxydocella sp. ULO1]|uniref:class I SAM-dependent DNA methyltransferase n=1 Tax=Carboxydocella sp. ULO1 TaxID=1926599 RepID=UPI0009AF16C7|nr:class I SAM-dependent methyltransferase [Carboxydocella sp. ULO1]GAW28626.1 SAM-dependent methyltransferase [Carboxydocella sp. ULO1]